MIYDMQLTRTVHACEASRIVSLSHYLRVMHSIHVNPDNYLQVIQAILEIDDLPYEVEEDSIRDLNITLTI